MAGPWDSFVGGGGSVKESSPSGGWSSSATLPAGLDRSVKMARRASSSAFLALALSVSRILRTLTSSLAAPWSISIATSRTIAGGVSWSPPAASSVSLRSSCTFCIAAHVATPSFLTHSLHPTPRVPFSPIISSAMALTSASGFLFWSKSSVKWGSSSRALLIILCERSRTLHIQKVTSCCWIGNAPQWQQPFFSRRQ